jgi:hypothetical protein
MSCSGSLKFWARYWAVNPRSEIPANGAGTLIVISLRWGLLDRILEGEPFMPY